MHRIWFLFWFGVFFLSAYTPVSFPIIFTLNPHPSVMDIQRNHESRLPELPATSMKLPVRLTARPTPPRNLSTPTPSSNSAPHPFLPLSLPLNIPILLSIRRRRNRHGIHITFFGSSRGKRRPHCPPRPNNQHPTHHSQRRKQHCREDSAPKHRLPQLTIRHVRVVVRRRAGCAG